MIPLSEVARTEFPKQNILDFNTCINMFLKNDFVGDYFGIVHENNGCVEFSLLSASQDLNVTKKFDYINKNIPIGNVSSIAYRVAKSMQRVKNSPAVLILKSSSQKNFKSEVQTYDVIVSSQYKF